MSVDSIDVLTEHLKAHLGRLVMLREYHQNVDDPYVKSALNFAIEDTQEAIAHVSSRLRQVGSVSPTQISNETSEKLLHQSRSRKTLKDKIKFVHSGLSHQVAWYNSRIPELKHDSDTQAVLVALGEQAKLRLERWESLMVEMKVL
jgi:hypothetical protein